MITYKGKMLTAYRNDELMAIVSKLVMLSLKSSIAASNESVELGNFTVVHAGDASHG